jgi:hypothetical protein
MSEPGTLAHVDFRDEVSGDLTGATTLVSSQAGVVDGVAVGFELDLADDVVLTHDPAHPRVGSWTYYVALLGEPINVAAGDALDVTLRRQHPVSSIRCVRGAKRN